MAGRQAGNLTVICGSMYSGKSEELIRRARRALYARRRVQVFKPAIDDRFDQAKVVTHEGITFNAVPVHDVAELKSKIKPDTDTVCVEEVQFFDRAIVDFGTEWADRGNEAIFAGLDQDFRRKPFGAMPELLAVADDVIKLRAICVKCGRTASHTYRMVDGKPAREDDPVVLIGATEIYEARCRACYRLRAAKGRRRA